MRVAHTGWGTTVALHWVHVKPHVTFRTAHTLELPPLIVPLRVALVAEHRVSVPLHDWMDVHVAMAVHVPRSGRSTTTVALVVVLVVTLTLMGGREMAEQLDATPHRHWQPPQSASQIGRVMLSSVALNPVELARIHCLVPHDDDRLQVVKLIGDEELNPTATSLHTNVVLPSQSQLQFICVVQMGVGVGLTTG